MVGCTRLPYITNRVMCMPALAMAPGCRLRGQTVALSGGTKRDAYSIGETGDAATAASPCLRRHSSKSSALMMFFERASQFMNERNRAMAPSHGPLPWCSAVTLNCTDTPYFWDTSSRA